MNDKAIIGGVLALLLGVGVLLFVTGDRSSVPGNTTGTGITTSEDGKLASGPNLPLAQCLKDKGAVFYGAFWCSHCLTQKELFKDAAPALPYVECSTADGNDQTFVCKEKKITGYPTWRFADGSELTGEQSFQALAEKSSCTAFLPGNTPPVTATTTAQ